MKRIPLALTDVRTPWARAWGLLGRHIVPPGCAWVFRDCRSVHTWFMATPIDVIFCDAALRVLRVERRCQPWRMLADAAADTVVECAAGEAERLQIERGDAIVALGTQDAPDLH